MPSVSNDVQRCKNTRRNSVLNYKSAALPAELCRHLGKTPMVSSPKLKLYTTNGRPEANSAPKDTSWNSEQSRQPVSPQAVAFHRNLRPKFRSAFSFDAWQDGVASSLADANFRGFLCLSGRPLQQRFSGSPSSCCFSRSRLPAFSCWR